MAARGMWPEGADVSLRQPGRAERRRGGRAGHNAGAGRENEAAVIAQVRALLRQPEVVVGTWRAARGMEPGVTEQEVLEALERIEPLWDELFPAERARIVRLLVDRVDVRADGAAVRLRLDGLGSLVRDIEARNIGIERAAA